MVGVRVTVRLSPALVARLDGFGEARGLTDRSKAVRAALREAVALDLSEQDDVMVDAEVAEADEVLGMLSDSARDGSVTAMKALLEWHADHEYAHRGPALHEQLEQQRRERRANSNGNGHHPPIEGAP